MREEVKHYYGQVLQSSADLKTDACVTNSSMPSYMKALLANIHEEVLQRYYGCGLVSPQLLTGAKVLDLGCGSGRDCYVLSQLVGESGYVVGVDMTHEQLAIANKYIDYHTRKFAYSKPNVEFRRGYIERLEELGLQDNSFDVIVSNCVVNLSPDKEAVLKEAYRLLKSGGELYFSDIYADRRISRELASDPVLYGECLSGAFYWNDFHNTAKGVGFLDPRLVEDRRVCIENEELKTRIGEIGFFSATYRLFKLPELEPACEDYGQAVIYKGSVSDHEQRFVVDKHHVIEKGKVFRVCGNTWRMLHNTRFAEHFDFIGNWDTHFGIFESCGVALPFDTETQVVKNTSGCC